MVYNSDILFLHIGKTGGMSCASYLLQTLPPPVYNCHREAEAESLVLSRDGIIPIQTINRHCTLQAALAHLRELDGCKLSDFERVVAVIRHPLSLEYSFYRHLQKPEVRLRRQHDKNILELSRGDFKTFVRKGGYHRQGLQQQDYFLLNGRRPKNLVLVRFENLDSEFRDAVDPFVGDNPPSQLPHLNASVAIGDAQPPVDDELRELIHEKHRYMFDSGLYSLDC